MLLRVALLCLILALLGLVVKDRYWLGQPEATRAADEFMTRKHPDLYYDSIRVLRKLNGHWGVQFNSKPPVRVDVDRQGNCREP